jgi:energy-coupling factor transporter ATP-binding protein EcfA2
LSGRRGSEWHRWDPHIHTPGTLHEDAYPVADGWERFLHAVESAEPEIRALGVTDYCITRSYERAREAKDRGRLRDCSLLFPNVELRLDTGTIKGNWVNIHLLVSPDDPNHVSELNRFLGRLVFSGFDDKFACTPTELRRLGRCAGGTELDDASALKHGARQFKVSRDNLVETYRAIGWAQGNILIAVSANADGTSGVKEAADATLRAEIEKASHLLFTSSPKQRDFWLGRGRASTGELRARYGGLKPCIWGSDAHGLDRVGNPDEQRLCWIKGQPAFDSLRQAVIDPDRAYIGAEPPVLAAASQIIDGLSIEMAPWVRTPAILLNPGLVAVIGARGSGKTALVDMIAAGCDSYQESVPPSFLARAAEHLAGASVTIAWSAGDPSRRALDAPVSDQPDAYPRARYLSQQFVEELCSIEGMPTLIREIERVVFEAHPLLERDGATDFDELLDLRVRHHRESRRQQELALEDLSEQIGIELDKSRQVVALQAQVLEKKKLVARYGVDRKALLPKGPNEAAARLQELRDAVETVRGYIRQFANRQATLLAIGGEVSNFRHNEAPAALRAFQARHQHAGLDEPQWKRFRLDYSGDVEEAVTARSDEAAKQINAWRGVAPSEPVDDTGAFVGAAVDLRKTPLAVLEAEGRRLEKVVAMDADTARRLAAINKRIADESAVLDSLKERLDDCGGAKERATRLADARTSSYTRVFEAIIAEQQVLEELYAPLTKRLERAGGTLAKLSFTVRRVADVDAWAKAGEDDLFDLRTGPFKGIGSLAKIANDALRPAWTKGDAAAVSSAMARFRDAHHEALLEKAPVPRSDQTRYRRWTRRFAKWLYSTNHISIEYGISYDGTDIRKLSPGTRGIVLVLLYLALDDDDDRPLIIDQPEENLDPQSVNDELVPLFQAARRRRQVIMVTHNANLVVNTDADQIIVANVGASIGGGLPAISYESGGLDEQRMRTLVCKILEGGERAFMDRARRLRIVLER